MNKEKWTRGSMISRDNSAQLHPLSLVFYDSNHLCLNNYTSRLVIIWSKLLSGEFPSELALRTSTEAGRGILIDAVCHMTHKDRVLRVAQGWV